MDDMQQKLNAILSNPDMMQQLMGMAQSLGQSQPAQAPVQEPQEPIPIPGFGSQGPDVATLQRIAGLAQQTGIDKNQQALLRSLSPYLNSEHIAKLEKAMRAAKLAALAGTFLGTTTLFPIGR